MNIIAQRILLATDGESASADAVDLALKLAKHCGADLYVVYVAQLAPVSSGESAAVVEEEKALEFSALDAVTAKIARIATAFGVRCTTRTTYSEDVVLAVLSASIDWACDLIVIGASTARASSQSTEMGRQIIARSQTPVLIVP